MVTKPTAKKPPARRPGTQKMPHVVRHGVFFLSLAVGIAALAVSFAAQQERYAVAIGANAMFITYLAGIAHSLKRLTPEFLRQRADEEDTPVGFILLVVVAVVAVSFYGLFKALRHEPGVGPAYDLMALSIVSVVLGWFAIHTMAALHYAYEYYESPDGTMPSARSADGISGGLEFPGKEAPDGIAFLYFAYAIGTAFAVSDVNATTNKMRRLIMVHSVFGYFFNTLIVAATVNVAVAVGAT